MKRNILFLHIFLTITIPSLVFAQSVFINEIAWPVNAAYAANGLKMGTVIINEVAWMGSPVEGVEGKQWWRYEWLELYNSGGQSVSLDGWALTLYKGEELYFSISPEGSISSQGYFLAGASDKILGVDVNYSNLGGKFLNDGMHVTLKNALGEIIDEVDARSGWPAGDNKTKQTMERVGGSDPPTLWQTSKDSGGTPKAQNSSGFTVPEKSKKYFGDSSNISRNSAVQGNEKDLSGSSGSFQQGISMVHPLTLLAGLLALGSSGTLLLAKRYLALRPASPKLQRGEQKHQKTSV